MLSRHNEKQKVRRSDEERSMSISSILNGKPAGVFSVLPTDTIATVAAMLAL